MRGRKETWLAALGCGRRRQYGIALCALPAPLVVFLDTPKHSQLFRPFPARTDAPYMALRVRFCIFAPNSRARSGTCPPNGWKARTQAARPPSLSFVFSLRPVFSSTAVHILFVGHRRYHISPLRHSVPDLASRFPMRPPSRPISSLRIIPPTRQQLRSAIASIRHIFGSAWPVE